MGHHPLYGIWPPLYYYLYRRWQQRVYRMALEWDAEEHFDVVHQLNMVGYREPGYLWQMPQPFVWGPIGGFNIVPWCMIPSMGLRGMIYQTVYNLLNAWQMRTLRRVRKAMNKAAVLLAATTEVQQAIRRLYGRDSELMPEVGFEGENAAAPALREKGERLRLCWSGQHTPGKSLQLLLEALALLKRDDWELHVIGEGERTTAWKCLARRLGLKQIIWYGWVARERAHELMQQAHVFCITSMKDLTSTVILEALSFGLPVIAPDHCGFRNVLHEGCGRKIAIRSKRQFVEDYAAAIAEWADDEALRRRLSQGAVARAREFDWTSKGKRLAELYRDAVAQAVEAPGRHPSDFEG
ncbi:MAG: glycosyltransferase family 4 protein [Akkermansia sp.]